MESEEKVEMIKNAISKLMEDDETNALVAVHEDNENAGDLLRRHNHRQLLSELLSELEQDKDGSEESKQENILSSETDEKRNTSNSEEVGNDDIIKELKNIKRQNSITHYLVTAMIAITLAWQISEVSLILKIKDGLSNPFKSVGRMVKGFLKDRAPNNNVQDVMKEAASESESQKQLIPPTCLPGLKIPELPSLDLPGLLTTSDDDDV